MSFRYVLAPAGLFSFAFCVAVSISSTALSQDHSNPAKKPEPCVLGFTHNPKATGPFEKKVVNSVEAAAASLQDSIDKLMKLVDDMGLPGANPSAAAGSSTNPLTTIRLKLQDQILGLLAKIENLSSAPPELLVMLEECFDNLRKIERLETELKAKGLDFDKVYPENAAATVAQNQGRETFSGLQGKVEIVEKTSKGRLKVRLDPDLILKERNNFWIRLGLSKDEIDKTMNQTMESKDSPLNALFGPSQLTPDHKWVLTSHLWELKPTKYNSPEELKALKTISLSMIKFNQTAQIRAYRLSGLIEDSELLHTRILDDLSDATKAGYVPEFVYAYHTPVFQLLNAMTTSLFEFARTTSPNRRKVIYEAIPNFFEALLPSASICYEYNINPQLNRISSWFKNDLPDPLFFTQISQPLSAAQYSPVPSSVAKAVADLGLKYLLLVQRDRGFGAYLDVLRVQAYAHTIPHVRMYKQLGMKPIATADNLRWNVNGVNKMEGNIVEILNQLNKLPDSP
jgi:hypothetical protein